MLTRHIAIIATLITLATLLCEAPAQEPTAMQQARDAASLYEFDKARDLIADMRAANRRNRKKNPLPEGLDALEAEIDRVSDMLGRVERLEIIDSVNVPVATFFTAYGLSPATGSLVSGADIDAGIAADALSPVFVSEDGTMLLWGASDKKGKVCIVEADRLVDGSYTEPVPVKGDLGQGAVNFPFMMPDGVTMYYAAVDPQGLGGYDILMTRREDDAFLLPQNMGMPYNSPANDYMLVIDEQRGLGWWATDRNSPKGMVTVYTFIPTDMRSNYPADTPNLAALARVHSIRDTWVKGRDYASLLSAEPVTAKVDDDEFAINIPGKGVYRSMGSFTNDRARQLMGDLLDTQERLYDLETDLERDRTLYGKGDKSLAATILQAETEADNLRTQIKRLRNEVVRAESAN